MKSPRDSATDTLTRPAFNSHSDKFETEVKESRKGSLAKLSVMISSGISALGSSKSMDSNRSGRGFSSWKGGTMKGYVKDFFKIFG